MRPAGLMFAIEDDEVGTDEVGTDEVGIGEVGIDEVLGRIRELASMTGGNVTSMLAGTCQLSLPSVVSGRDYAGSQPGAVTARRLAMACDGELVVMTLLQRQTACTPHGRPRSP